MRGGLAGLALAFVLGASLPASAQELAGVTMPDSLTAGETTLARNGLGLRNNAMFKVYVGGLYLEAPNKDAAAILGSNQAKPVRTHFMHDLRKEQLASASREGFAANAKERAVAQETSIGTLTISARPPTRPFLLRPQSKERRGKDS
jgi:hypothetical protein